MEILKQEFYNKILTANNQEPLIIEARKLEIFWFIDWQNFKDYKIQVNWR